MSGIPSSKVEVPLDLSVPKASAILTTDTIDPGGQHRTLPTNPTLGPGAPGMFVGYPEPHLALPSSRASQLVPSGFSDRTAQQQQYVYSQTEQRTYPQTERVYQRTDRGAYSHPERIHPSQERPQAVSSGPKMQQTPVLQGQEVLARRAEGYLQQDGRYLVQKSQAAAAATQVVRQPPQRPEGYYHNSIGTIPSAEGPAVSVGEPQRILVPTQRPEQLVVQPRVVTERRIYPHNIIVSQRPSQPGVPSSLPSGSIPGYFAHPQHAQSRANASHKDMFPPDARAARPADAIPASGYRLEEEKPTAPPPHPAAHLAYPAGYLQVQKQKENERRLLVERVSKTPYSRTLVSDDPYLSAIHRSAMLPVVSTSMQSAAAANQIRARDEAVYRQMLRGETPVAHIPVSAAESNSLDPRAAMRGRGRIMEGQVPVVAAPLRTTPTLMSVPAPTSAYASHGFKLGSRVATTIKGPSYGMECVSGIAEAETLRKFPEAEQTIERVQKSSVYPTDAYRLVPKHPRTFPPTTHIASSVGVTPGVLPRAIPLDASRHYRTSQYFPYQVPGHPDLKSQRAAGLHSTREVEGSRMGVMDTSRAPEGYREEASPGRTLGHVGPVPVYTSEASAQAQHKMRVGPASYSVRPVPATMPQYPAVVVARYGDRLMKLNEETAKHVGNKDPVITITDDVTMTRVTPGQTTGVAQMWNKQTSFSMSANKSPNMNTGNPKVRPGPIPPPTMGGEGRIAPPVAMDYSAVRNKLPPYSKPVANVNPIIHGAPPPHPSPPSSSPLKRQSPTEEKKRQQWQAVPKDRYTDIPPLHKCDNIESYIQKEISEQRQQKSLSPTVSITQGTTGPIKNPSKSLDPSKTANKPATYANYYAIENANRINPFNSFIHRRFEEMVRKNLLSDDEDLVKPDTSADLSSRNSKLQEALSVKPSKSPAPRPVSPPHIDLTDSTDSRTPELPCPTPPVTTQPSTTPTAPPPPTQPPRPPPVSVNSQPSETPKPISLKQRRLQQYYAAQQEETAANERAQVSSDATSAAAKPEVVLAEGGKVAGNSSTGVQTVSDVPCCDRTSAQPELASLRLGPILSVGKIEGGSESVSQALYSPDNRTAAASVESVSELEVDSVPNSIVKNIEDSASLVIGVISRRFLEPEYDENAKKEGQDGPSKSLDYYDFKVEDDDSTSLLPFQEARRLEQLRKKSSSQEETSDDKTTSEYHQSVKRKLTDEGQKNEEKKKKRRKKVNSGMDLIKKHKSTQPQLKIKLKKTDLVKLKYRRKSASFDHQDAGGSSSPQDYAVSKKQHGLFSSPEGSGGSRVGRPRKPSVGQQKAGRILKKRSSTTGMSLRSRSASKEKVKRKRPAARLANSLKGPQKAKRMVPASATSYSEPADQSESSFVVTDDSSRADDSLPGRSTPNSTPQKKRARRKEVTPEEKQNIAKHRRFLRHQIQQIGKQQGWEVEPEPETDETAKDLEPATSSIWRKLLFEKPSDFRYMPPRGYAESPLQLAIRRGQKKIISYLLQQTGTNVLARDLRGRTALHEACAGGDTATVTQLLRHGAKVDAGCDTHTTPLSLAEKEGHHAIIHLLQQVLSGSGSALVASSTCRASADDALPAREEDIKLEVSADPMPRTFYLASLNATNHRLRNYVLLRDMKERLSTSSDDWLTGSDVITWPRRALLAAVESTLSDEEMTNLTERLTEEQVQLLVWSPRLAHLLGSNFSYLCDNASADQSKDGPGQAKVAEMSRLTENYPWERSETLDCDDRQPGSSTSKSLTFSGVARISDDQNAGGRFPGRSQSEFPRAVLKSDGRNIEQSNQMSQSKRVKARKHKSSSRYSNLKIYALRAAKRNQRQLRSALQTKQKLESRKRKLQKRANVKKQKCKTATKQVRTVPTSTRTVPTSCDISEGNGSSRNIIVHAGDSSFAEASRVHVNDSALLANARKPVVVLYDSYDKQGNRRNVFPASAHELD